MLHIKGRSVKGLRSNGHGRPGIIVTHTSVIAEARQEAVVSYSLTLNPTWLLCTFHS